MKDVGLYIHIPFCATKCAYCNFYSLTHSEHLMDEYVNKLIQDIESFKNRNVTANTIYFGGGTPTLLGAERLATVLNYAKAVFGNAQEITLECNPNSVTQTLANKVAEAGVNRVSIGMQSACSLELKFLGRSHSVTDVGNSVEIIRSAGINNISLDLIMGLENQTYETLVKSIDYCGDLRVQHISLYMLKVEPDTPLAKRQLFLPGDDEICDMYLMACDYLQNLGYNQYEISNFCTDSYMCHHNLKYWHCQDYIGVGAAAHSCFLGQRYYYSANIEEYMNGGKPIIDGNSGGIEEYLMLNLRLTAGVSLEYIEKAFLIDKNILLNKIGNLLNSNLIKLNNDNLSLTQEGFLVSNQIIYKIINYLTCK